MGDLFENTSQFGTSEPTTNTEVIATATTPEAQQREPEGVIFSYQSGEHDYPITEELSNLLTQGVKRTIEFSRNLNGLAIAVSEAVNSELTDIADGQIPEGYVNADNVAECRKLRTKLNGLFDNIETERKTMKKIVSAPYDHLNDGYKDATYLLRLAIDTLTTQINKVEDEEKARKKEGVKHIILDKAKDYRTDLPEYLMKYDALMSRVFKDSMLNKSQSDTKTQQMIMEGLGAISADLSVIDGYKDPAEREAIKNNFLESGSLAQAIERRQRYQANMDFLAELDRKAAEAERATVAQSQQTVQPTVVPATPAPQPQTTAPQKIQLTQVGPQSVEKFFHIWHDGPNADEAFRALTQFLKSNGFHRENMKEIYTQYINN